MEKSLINTNTLRYDLKRKSIVQTMSQVVSKEIIPEILKTKRQKVIY